MKALKTICHSPKHIAQSGNVAKIQYWIYMHLLKLYRADFFQSTVTEFKVVTIYASFARVGLYPGLCWVQIEERNDKILLFGVTEVY